MKYIEAVLLAIWVAFGRCTDPSASWTNVTTSTALYQSLPPCAQACIYSVTDATICKAYDCVCAGSTPYSAFIVGYTYISTCTIQMCNNNQTTRDAATNAFRDICAVVRDPSSPPTTPTGGPPPTSVPGAAGEIIITIRLAKP